MLLVINWCYWEAGKNSRMHMKIQGRLMQACCIEIHQVFSKKKIRLDTFFNWVVYVNELIKRWIISKYFYSCILVYLNKMLLSALYLVYTLIDLKFHPVMTSISYYVFSFEMHVSNGRAQLIWSCLIYCCLLSLVVYKKGGQSPYGSPRKCSTGMLFSLFPPYSS